MMIASVRFQHVNLSLSNYRAYLLGVAFVLGNMILPQLCHMIPDGGKMLLPIYFFTLIASYKFGIRVGLLTALFSPLCNHLLFGMPPAGVLPILLIKSSLLAISAAYVAHKTHQLSLWHVAIAVIAYQIAGGVAEWLLSGSLSVALQDFTLGFPGILIQIVGGWFLLKILAEYEL